MVAMIVVAAIAMVVVAAVVDMVVVDEVSASLCYGLGGSEKTKHSYKQACGVVIVVVVVVVVVDIAVAVPLTVHVGGQPTAISKQQMLFLTARVTQCNHA